MVSSRILKRRKRAQVGTLLAVLLILLPLPAGAYFYGQMTDLQDQSVVFTMDGTPDDAIFDQSLVEYDNTTDTYTYTKEDESGTVMGNFTSDIDRINFQYTNSSGTGYSAGTDGLSYSESDNNIFLILEKGGDPASSLVFGTPLATSYQRPNIAYVTTVSPDDMLENNVDSIRVYFENNQELNLTYTLGVYDPDADPYPFSYEYEIGIRSIDGTGVVDTGYGNFEIACQQDVSTSVNGSWVDIEIPETELLKAATSHGDGYVFLTVSDVDGSTLEETNGILVGMEMIGSDDSPVTMSGIWQAALVATGMFGLVGAIIATPYMSIEGLTGDGMQGQRYKKGYNPRKKYNKRRK